VRDIPAQHHLIKRNGFIKDLRTPAKPRGIDDVRSVRQRVGVGAVNHQVEPELLEACQLLRDDREGLLTIDEPVWVEAKVADQPPA